jgi:hypothetical protein
MAGRKNYRHARRARKTRYSAPRFHRAKPKGWLPPTIRQKKDSLVRVVKDMKRLLNITSVVVEEGQFDTSALAAGQPLHGTAYQIPRYAGRDFRAKVLWRDGYRCQHCGSVDHLQAHHIQPRAQGGPDTPENGLTLCEECHTALHHDEWRVTNAPKTFIYPAHLQVGKHYLRHALAALGLSVEPCVGWVTAYWRAQIGLDKSHIHDAAALVCRDYAPRWWAVPYRILPKRKKVWEDNPTKTCEERHGFRHWDLVAAQHRTRGRVLGSVRSLKTDALTLRTAWDDNFPVSYRKSRLVWRFDAIIYI